MCLPILYDSSAIVACSKMSSEFHFTRAKSRGRGDQVKGGLSRERLLALFTFEQLSA